MCGLFGFIGSQPPDLDRLAQVALLAETRGPHAFGFAWIEKGRLVNYRAAAPISERLSSLSRLARTTRLIGNCRLATSGSWLTNTNNQPLVAEGWAVSHNGNIYNAAGIFEQLGYTPKTRCDSEALLIAAAKWGVESALKIIDQSSPLAALFLTPDRFIYARQGSAQHPPHPLYAEVYPEGTYLCSRKISPASILLPIGVTELL